MLSVTCPGCRKNVRAPVKYAGQTHTPGVHEIIRLAVDVTGLNAFRFIPRASIALSCQ